MTDFERNTIAPLLHRPRSAENPVHYRDLPDGGREGIQDQIGNWMGEGLSMTAAVRRLRAERHVLISVSTVRKWRPLWLDEWAASHARFLAETTAATPIS